MQLEREYHGVGGRRRQLVGRGGGARGGRGVGRWRQRRALGFTSVRPFPQLSQTGFLASLVPAHLRRLYQLLLFTLPGTPVFNYGDEIGLEAAALPGQVRLAAYPPARCGEVVWVAASRRVPCLKPSLIPG